jgi:hypothetical protein
MASGSVGILSNWKALRRTARIANVGLQYYGCSILKLKMDGSNCPFFFLKATFIDNLAVRPGMSHEAKKQVLSLDHR